MGESVAGADPAAAGPYLARVLGDPAWADCAITLISGGKSNLTYDVRSPAGRVVLRRPPLGHVLPTAHDMAREHRVIAALAGTAVPVPAALHLCTDPAVLGAPFQVMEFVAGPVVRDVLPDGYAPDPPSRLAIAEGLVGTLAALHAIVPADVGLEGFGRPDGYLARQVARWRSQWDATPGAESAELTALADGLAAAVPSSGPGCVVHGDFRIDNTVLDRAVPGRIAAVLDWEMSTLGDPLADLGLLLVYWAQDGDDPVRRAAARGSHVTALPGFPGRARVAQLYAGASGRDVGALPWYVAFGFFKLAVVVAGVAARHRAGAMVGPGFEGIERALDPLVTLGRRTLRTGEIG